MCIVDNRKYLLAFPKYSGMSGDSVLAWKMSHFVKHVILEPVLDLYQVLQIDCNNIKMIGQKLREDFNCSLMNNENLLGNQKIFVCTYCPSLHKCIKEFKDYMDSYISYIQNVAREDIKKPRHIYFNAGQETGSLAFVNDAGVIVVTKNRSNKLILKSGHRPFRNTALITPMMSLLKNTFADRYYLALAIKTIERRIARGKYTNMKKRLEKNWQ